MSISYYCIKSVIAQTSFLQEAAQTAFFWCCLIIFIFPLRCCVLLRVSPLWFLPCLTYLDSWFYKSLAWLYTLQCPGMRGSLPSPTFEGRPRQGIVPHKPLRHALPCPPIAKHIFSAIDRSMEGSIWRGTDKHSL